MVELMEFLWWNRFFWNRWCEKWTLSFSSLGKDSLVVIDIKTSSFRSNDFGGISSFFFNCFIKHLSRIFFKLTTCKTLWASESINGCSSLVNNISIIYYFHSQQFPIFFLQRFCYFCSNKINTPLLKRVHSWNGIDINNPKQNQRLNCNNAIKKKRQQWSEWEKRVPTQKYTANPQLKTHKERRVHTEKESEEEK